MSREFFIPQKILTGRDAMDALSPVIKEYGSKALIVTGKTVVTLDPFKKLTCILSENGISYEVFSGITGEPDDTMIEQGAEIYKNSGCDFLIGIGGGSPLDAMKAIAVCCVSGKNICDYYGKVITEKLPPMIAIPTTAGTGSEATQFTVITDSKNNIKMLLKGKNLIPDVAVVDGSLGITSPKSITASTGLDALTHAVESYTSRRAQPLTDGICISAVKRIFKYLVTAYNDGNDIQAREEMSIAALEAGIAINNASVTIVHGMSRPIGAIFDVPHGTSNAMLLPKCMEFAKDGAQERFAELGRAIGIADSKNSDEYAANAFVKSLEEICESCEIPTPQQYGIDKQSFMANIEKMADDALASGSPANTIKSVTKDDILKIYRSLYE